MFAVPLIGGAVSAVGQVMQASAAAKAGRYNAEVSRNNARTARYEGQIEINDRMREMRQQLGSLRAAYGSSGIQFAGSGMDLLRDTATEYAWDVAKIGYKSEVRAVGAETQAEMEEAEAKNAMPTAVIGAATSLLKGAGTAYGMSSGYGYTYGTELAG